MGWYKQGAGKVDIRHCQKRCLVRVKFEREHAGDISDETTVRIKHINTCQTHKWSCNARLIDKLLYREIQFVHVKTLFTPWSLDSEHTGKITSTQTRTEANVTFFFFFLNQLDGYQTYDKFRSWNNGKSYTHAWIILFKISRIQQPHDRPLSYQKAFLLRWKLIDRVKCKHFKCLPHSQISFGFILGGVWTFLELSEHMSVFTKRRTICHQNASVCMCVLEASKTLRVTPRCITPCLKICRGKRFVKRVFYSLINTRRKKTRFKPAWNPHQ